ncbi:MAG: AAA family ATPase [bacterium]
MKKKIYITGASGTGKSTVGQELKRRGHSVIDIDDEDFCSWYDKNGIKYTENNRPDENWLDEHCWNCDLPKLEKAIENSIDDDVFIIGISSNLDHYSFDQIFLLTLDADTLIQRLTERTTNDFAKDPAEQQYVLKIKDQYEKMMLEKVAIVLDSSKPVASIVDEILEKY